MCGKFGKVWPSALDARHSVLKRVAGCVLALCPALCAATDTLNCNGDRYSVQFHVGSEGIGDFALFEPGGVVTTGDRDDLVVYTLEWPRGEGNFAANFIEVRTKDGQPVAFELSARGRQGRVVVKGAEAQVVCDWIR